MRMAGRANTIWKAMGTRHAAEELLMYAKPKTSQYERASPNETKAPALIMRIVPLRWDFTHSAWYAGAVDVVKPLPVSLY